MTRTRDFQRPVAGAGGRAMREDDDRYRRVEAELKQAVREGIVGRGGRVERPLGGLGIGRRLAFDTEHGCLPPLNTEARCP